MAVAIRFWELYGSHFITVRVTVRWGYHPAVQGRTCDLKHLFNSNNFATSTALVRYVLY